jgi:uncharacterized membrane protein
MKTNNLRRFVTTLVAETELSERVFSAAAEILLIDQSDASPKKEKAVARLLKEGAPTSDVARSLMAAAFAVSFGTRDQHETQAVSLFKHAVKNGLSDSQVVAAKALATKVNEKGKKSFSFNNMVTILINGERAETVPVPLTKKVKSFIAAVKKDGGLLSDDDRDALRALLKAQDDLATIRLMVV